MSRSGQIRLRSPSQEDQNVLPRTLKKLKVDLSNKQSPKTKGQAKPKIKNGFKKIAKGLVVSRKSTTGKGSDVDVDSARTEVVLADDDNGTEEEEEAPRLSKLAKKVKRLYERIKKESHDQQAIDNIWQKNVKVVTPKEEVNNVEIKPKPLSPNIGQSKPRRVVTIMTGEKKTLSVPIINKFPHEERLPPMMYWVEIERNMKAKDKKVMRCMPYFCDEDLEDDKEFYSQLSSLYDVQLDDEVLTDDLFYDLVGRAIKKFEEMKLKENNPSSSALPGSEVYAAISEALPELGTLEKISERYLEILAKRTGLELSQDNQNLEESIPNRRSEAEIENSDPCGSSCHRSASSSSPVNISFAPEEEAKYRIAAKVHRGDFCMIAAFLTTKNCREVCEYALRQKTEYRKPRKDELVKDNILKQYVPCNHEGNCSPDNPNCPCFKSGIFCEKACVCDDDCVNRFAGCKCAGKCKFKNCGCASLQRECDPDLCGKCVDPGSCLNMEVQKGHGKNTYVDISKVAGWGCFLEQGANKGDYICEYLGEIISQQEADRRGKIYDRIKTSYLFEINNDCVLDSTLKGNNIRFANHSKKDANLIVKNLRVDGEHHIAFFASRDIKPKEELLFDYSSSQRGLNFSIPVWTKTDKKSSKNKQKKN